MKKYLLVCIAVVCLGSLQAHAKKVRALFLGNSYTDVNNLPELVKQLALSVGDTLEYAKNTPGGYTLQGHSTNTTSLNLIQAGNWDFVVLQEQSQLPSFPDADVEFQVYPFAAKLDSIIKVNNACATTVFYMTWGRKNGDASNCGFFPVVCTYAGMDSMLQLRYSTMARDNNAALAPVGEVWRELRTNYAAIELYNADESHPSNQGSFAAACTFYSIMFRKNPELTTYNFTVSASNADTIKTVAKAKVFDRLDYCFEHAPNIVSAGFLLNVSGFDVAFTNKSANADSYSWNFGDGQTSTAVSPTHTYTAPGMYQVQLTAQDDSCNHTHIATKTVVIAPTDIQSITTAFSCILFPNPAGNVLNVQTNEDLAEISILNLDGKTVIAVLLPEKRGSQYSVDISTLPAGNYWAYSYSQSNKKAVLQFIKE